MSFQDIQTAIQGLPPEELAALMQWIEQYRADQWDEQNGRDAEAGRFETLRRRVHDQKTAGECRPL